MPGYEKYFLFAFPVINWVFAIYTGLWWLSGDVIQAVIFGVGLVVYNYEVGYKKFYQKNRIYFVAFGFLPCLFGIVMLFFGFYLVGFE